VLFEMESGIPPLSFAYTSKENLMRSSTKKSTTVSFMQLVQLKVPNGRRGILAMSRYLMKTIVVRAPV